MQVHTSNYKDHEKMMVMVTVVGVTMVTVTMLESNYRASPISPSYLMYHLQSSQRVQDSIFFSFFSF